MSSEAQPPTAPVAPRNRDSGGAAVRVLLASPEQGSVSPIGALLSSLGSEYEIHTAPSLGSAIQALDAGPFDICLVAPELGDAKGIDLIREAAANARRVPMALLGASDDPVAEAEAFAAGAADYLPLDSLDAARLNRALHGALGRSRAGARLGARLEELERDRRHLLSILGRLRAGTVVTGEGKAIEFISDSARALLGWGDEERIGSAWDEVFLVDESARLSLADMVQRPALQRTKVTARIEAGSGGAEWIDFEVHDDPADGNRRIFFLYDASEIYSVRGRLSDRGRYHDLVGTSRAMKEVYQRIREVAKVPMGVLIQGETGTGKELVARAIHYSGNRKATPFIAVNCAGLPESLLSSQLFGHKRGAFTGAVEDNKGVFESAHGGTLLLDEIGEIPRTVQVTLLRVLQEQEVTRLGESMPRKINTRVICATNRDLWQEVQEGRFRADLFYRVRVARIDLPTLRERKGDLPLLAVHFLELARVATGKDVTEISADAMRLLEQHDWPGNVRELKNAVEFALVRCAGQIVQAADLPPEVRPSMRGPLAQGPKAAETSRILKALDDAQGNRSRAARLLGVSRATFYRRLAELHPGIERKRA